MDDKIALKHSKIIETRFEKLGILALGQTPRADFEKIMSRHLRKVKLIIRGGLDDLSRIKIDEIASAGGSYPLFTILRDGAIREISLFKLKPLLELKIREMVSEGITLAVLMCTADFPYLESSIPVLYPGRILKGLAQGITQSKRIGVIIPNEGQKIAATKSWKDNGFYPKIFIASPTDHDAIKMAAFEFCNSRIELVVLDCMGFTPSEVRRVRGICKKPVLCPQAILPLIISQILSL